MAAGAQWFQLPTRPCLAPRRPGNSVAQQQAQLRLVSAQPLVLHLQKADGLRTVALVRRARRHRLLGNLHRHAQRNVVQSCEAGGDAQGGQVAPIGVVEQVPDLVRLKAGVQGQPDLQAGDVAVAQEPQQALVIEFGPC